MRRKFWWPGALSDQVTLMRNFQSKIESYGAVLGLTPQNITDALALCTTFIGAYELTEQSRASMQAMTQWRGIVFNGDDAGDAAPAPPVFPVAGELTYTRGVVTQFFRLREKIVSSDNYTASIGEDLGIVGDEIAPRSVDQITPKFKAAVLNGSHVQLTGSLQKMDAVRVEYAPNGGEFRTVAFLTSTPASFRIDTAVKNQAESGVIRTVFIKKNQPVGNFSPNYPITIA